MTQRWISLSNSLQSTLPVSIGWKTQGCTIVFSWLGGWDLVLPPNAVVERCGIQNQLLQPSQMYPVFFRETLNVSELVRKPHLTAIINNWYNVDQPSLIDDLKFILNTLCNKQTENVILWQTWGSRDWNLITRHSCLTHRNPQLSKKGSSLATLLFLPYTLDRGLTEICQASRWTGQLLVKENPPGFS